MKQFLVKTLVFIGLIMIGSMIFTIFDLTSFQTLITGFAIGVIGQILTQD